MLQAFTDNKILFWNKAFGDWRCITIGYRLKFYVWPNIVYVNDNYILLSNINTISTFEEDQGLHRYLAPSIFCDNENLPNPMFLLAT